jgi:hypothetical protein
MKSYDWAPARRLVYSILALAALTSGLWTAGCANYGRLQEDLGVMQSFKSGSVPGNYRYYWYGTGSQFYALAGIDPRYTLESRVWRQLSPGTEEFSKAVEWMWEDYGYTTSGAYILDPGGSRVGVWYSSLRYSTVKFGENHQIMLIPDMPFLGGPDGNDNFPK